MRIQLGGTGNYVLREGVRIAKKDVPASKGGLPASKGCVFPTMLH